jgi:hypothetical protein
MELVREGDHDNLVEATGSSIGSREIGDFVKVGLGVGKAIDGGAGGSGGVYTDYGASNADLNQFKFARNKRQGGFLYWLTGGRT